MMDDVFQEEANKPLSRVYCQPPISREKKPAGLKTQGRRIMGASPRPYIISHDERLSLA